MISICIPSWNTRELLRECLASLEATCRIPHEVIVVDNGSEDGSAEMVKSDFPRVELVENGINRGYAGATNQAIDLAQGEMIVLLNSDTRLHEDTLGEMSEFLDSCAEAGAAGPVLRRANGSLQRSWGTLPSLGTELARALLLDRVGSLPWNGKVSPCEVGSLMGACLMVKRAALKEVGGLDEGFLHYGEDVDLCWRLKRAGWKLYFLPRLEMTHHGAASSRRVRRQAWLNYHRSKCRLFRKHLGPSAAAMAKLLLATEALVKGAAALGWPSPAGRRKVRDCAALLRRIGGF